MGKLNTVQNGKGSKNRVSNQQNYSSRHSEIDWSKKSPDIKDINEQPDNKPESKKF